MNAEEKSREKMQASCAMMLAILEREGHSSKSVVGIEDLSSDDTLFALAASAHIILINTIAIMASGKYYEALKGFQALKSEEHLSQACDVMHQHLERAGLLK